jgi:GNAT superfamily N-acetyltransferase
MHPPLIRPLQSADFAAWKTLWEGYNAFYGREGTTALPDEVTRTTWARFFDTHEPMHALVADLDGELLGVAHFLYHRSTIQLQPTCYLQDLYTLERARGRGVARALIEAVSDQARTAGTPRLYWQTHETNAIAMRLYDRIAQKSGFIVYRKVL